MTISIKTKAAALIAASILAAGLMGCQGGANDAPQQEEPAPQEEAQQQAPEPEPAGPDEMTQEVIDAIDAIGPDITLESGEAIDTARKGYTDLNKQQRELVSNYATLEAAEEQYKVLADTEAEKQRQYRIGDVAKGEDFEIELLEAEVTDTWESPEVDDCLVPNGEGTFVLLKFKVKALNSKELTMPHALADLEANYNGNQYHDWELKYEGGLVWMPASNMYCDADMTVDVYAGVVIPKSAESDGKPITVDGRIAGEEKHIVVRK